MDYSKNELVYLWDSFTKEQQSFLVSSAITQDESSLYRFFISKKVNINFQTEAGDSFLTSAICLLDRDLISFLIQKGADVNLQNKRKETPLFFSLHYGTFEDSLFLLRKGASLDECYQHDKKILNTILQFPRDDLQQFVTTGLKYQTISEKMVRKIKGNALRTLVS